VFIGDYRIGCLEVVIEWLEVTAGCSISYLIHM